MSAKEGFSLVALGWSSVAGAFILICVIVWMALTVVNTLTQPQPFLKSYIEDKENKKTLGPEMAITLEYESMAVRSQGVQVAFGFVVGLVFLATGLLLFGVAAVNAVRMVGKTENSQWTLSTTAPGLVPIVLGSILVGLAVQKDMRRTFSASMDRGGAPKVVTEQVRPPVSGKGLVPDDEETKGKRHP